MTTSNDSIYLDKIQKTLSLSKNSLCNFIFTFYPLIPELACEFVSLDISPESSYPPLSWGSVRSIKARADIPRTSRWLSSPICDHHANNCNFLLLKVYVAPFNIHFLIAHPGY